MVLSPLINVSILVKIINPFLKLKCSQSKLYNLFNTGEVSKSKVNFK